MSSFTCDPGTICAPHGPYAGNPSGYNDGYIYVAVNGTGTSWTGSTPWSFVFAPLGCSLVSVLPSSSTFAVLEIAVGSTLGVITITDGSTTTDLVVGPPTFTIVEPSFLPLNATTTVRLFGPNSVWSSESGGSGRWNFTVSGVADCSVALPAFYDYESTESYPNDRTVRLDIATGSNTGTLTITDEPTGATATIRVGPPVVIPIDYDPSPNVEYRYLAADVRTGNLLGELPLANLRYGRRLNGAGTLSATITLGQRSTLGTSLDRTILDAVTATRTAIYVARDDVLVWGGILWEHPDYDSATRTLAIGAAEFWSYFKRRRLRVDKDYFPAWDQYDIVRDLIDWAQAQPGGNIGVDTSATNLSGVTRDPEYRAFERRNIGQLVEEFSAAEDGFDFAIDISGSPGEAALTLNLAAERGRRPEATGLVFEPGKNLGGYKWPISGTSTANSIDAIGNGEGDDMLVANSTRTDLIDAGYPLLDNVVAYKTIDDPGQLASRAAAATAARAWPVTTATLVNVLPSGDPPLGSWIMGDWARFRVDDDERFPAQADGSPGIDRYVRIIADDVSVSDAGVETVNITVEVRDA